MHKQPCQTLSSDRAAKIHGLSVSNPYVAYPIADEQDYPRIQQSLEIFICYGKQYKRVLV
jgi:hypothetical protein